MQALLKIKGMVLGSRTISKIMKEEGLKAIQPRSFIPRTMESKHGKRVSVNLLLQQAKPTNPNQVWVSDITYLPMKNGKWRVPPRLFVCLTRLVHWSNC